MMERLREGVNSIAVKIILALIILSFVFAGVGSYIVGGGSNVAAKVGNIEIARGEFEQAYQQERNRLQSQLGDYFSNLLADPSYVASLRQSVLDRLVNAALLDQHAQDLGLRVSDKQVRELLLSLPAFQVDGQFNQEVYQSALRRQGLTPEGFAESIRRDLVRQQLIGSVQASDFILPSEVAAQSQLFLQTRDVKTINLALADFAAKVELSDEEIQQYYQQNPERYTRPEQAKVAYIELSAETIKNKVEISDEQAMQFYQEHLDKYSSDEQRQVSHILVEGDNQAKAQAILDELNAGADFAMLAQEKSEDIGSAEEGGSLGWIERGVMDPAFEEAAFTLVNAGDVTGLVKSEFGYHIIKLDALKDSLAKPYADVAESIKQEMRDQKAADVFYELQSELERVAFEFPDSLDDAAQAIDAEIVTTDFISQLDAPELLKAPAVMQAIVNPEVREDGLNSEVIEVAPEHVIVVRVEDTRDETVLPLEEVRSQVVAQLSRVKGEQNAIELANKVVAELEAGNNAILAENGLEFGEVETLDRSSPLAKVVFAMAKPAEGSVGYAQSKSPNGDVVVVELDAVSDVITTQYNEQISSQLLRMNSQQNLDGLISILRKNTEIEYSAVTQ